MGKASHSQGGEPSGTVVGAAEEAGAARAATVEVRAARGVAVGAAQGRNLGQTAGAGRGATSGSNPEGPPGLAGKVPRYLQRGGSCPHQKPRVEKRSGGLWRDQGSGSLCDRRNSQGRHTG
jgi:hypothetical protein